MKGLTLFQKTRVAVPLSSRFKTKWQRTLELRKKALGRGLTGIRTRLTGSLSIMTALLSILKELGTRTLLWDAL
jgi:hypothetical protein